MTTLALNPLRCFVLALLALCLPAALCHALPAFPPVVIQTYHPKDGGDVAKALQSCQFCHAVSGAPKLNPYGLDVKAALRQQNTKTLTEAVLKSVEDKDSDGDGFPNGAEIAADNLPGDPASKPAGAPPVKQTETLVNPAPAPATGSGFSLVGLLFPKHAQHPALVHFPIALFLMGLLFDIWGSRKRDKALLTAGWFNLIAAAFTSLLSLATGVVAWIQLYGLNALGSNTNLLVHLLLTLSATVIMWVLLHLRRRRPDGVTDLPRIYFTFAVLAAIALAIAGHLGGNLSGVNG